MTYDAAKWKRARVLRQQDRIGKGEQFAEGAVYQVPQARTTPGVVKDLPYSAPRHHWTIGHRPRGAVRWLPICMKCGWAWRDQRSCVS
jgi:hypothetical protein